MKTHPVHVQWPKAGPNSTWRRVAYAFRPTLIALLVLPVLVWVTDRLAWLMGQSAVDLAERPDIGHAVVSGVNVALLGIVVVILLCAVYGAAGWAVGGLIQAIVTLWPGSPKSRLGWALELGAIASAWGALFYALHRSVLVNTLPALAEPLLVDSLLLWFGVPGLAYAWAAALRQGNRI